MGSGDSAGTSIPAAVPLAFDVESCLIKPGMFAPRLVCSSWSDGRVLSRAETYPIIRDALLRATRGEICLIGHNIAYDLGVCCAEWGDLLPLVFAALDANGVSDTLIRHQLADIAAGTQTKGSLADLALKHLGVVLDKGPVRLRYHELVDVPLSRWSAEALTYARKDAETTLAVWRAQKPVTDEPPQVRAAWALHLISLYGMRTDGVAVATLKRSLEADKARLLPTLLSAGLLRANGTRDMKAIAAAVSAGGGTATTATGRVKTDRRALRKTGDAALAALAQYTEISKILDTYIPVFEARALQPIGCRYRTLVDSGRTSASAPNDQNLPRREGVREVFVPRPGYVYVACDYDTIELRAWAQTCLTILGHSDMAEAIRTGQDLHVLLAADIAGMPYETMLAQYKAGDKKMAHMRQVAKMANFALPGGMGAHRFNAKCEEDGVPMDLLQAKRLRDAWMRRWREARPYLEWIGRQDGPVVQLVSGRVRGGVSFCDRANTYFQGLTADGAKAALYAVAREQHTGMNALRGSHTVAFIHDELLLEVPEENLHEAAMRLQHIMITEMSRYIGVPVAASVAAMRRWYKGAKAVLVDGRLVPVKPVHTEKTTTWILDV